MEKQRWYQSWFWYGFFRSNYITACWNWFLILSGKAAEAVLTLSVVYSCARLLPTLHTPTWLDNTVFIWQMIALDVGGLSLRKMANQALKDGDKNGATIARRVSNALIGIMIANVALSVLQTIAPIPMQVVSTVEGILLIARAIMAVLYAHVIHSLLGEHHYAEQGAPSIDVSQVVSSALAEFSAKQEERFIQITTEQQRLIEMIQPVSYETLVQQMNARIDETVKRETVKHSESVSLHETVKRETPAPVSRNTQQNTEKIVSLPPRKTDQRNTQDVIWSLLDEDETRGPRELGRLANVSPATAKRHRDAYLTRLPEQSAM